MRVLVVLALCVVASQGRDTAAVKIVPSHAQTLFSLVRDTHPLHPIVGDDNHYHIVYHEEKLNKNDDMTGTANLQTGIGRSDGLVTKPVGPQFKDGATVMDKIKFIGAHMHASPRKGVDGHYHFLYNNEEEEGGQGAVPPSLGTVNTVQHNSQDGTVGSARSGYVQGGLGDVVGQGYQEGDKRWRSDMTDVPLTLGKWFHKIGEAYDVTENEWKLFSNKERALYARINNNYDIKHHSQDWVKPSSSSLSPSVKALTPTVMAATTVTTTPTTSTETNQEEAASQVEVPTATTTVSALVPDAATTTSDAATTASSDATTTTSDAATTISDAATTVSATASDASASDSVGESANVVSDMSQEAKTASGETTQQAVEETHWRSDFSNKELMFGSWYHKKGQAYDLTEDEWKLLSSEERAEYVLINNSQDISQHQGDWGIKAGETLAHPTASPATSTPTATLTPADVDGTDTTGVVDKSKVAGEAAVDDVVGESVVKESEGEAKVDGEVKGETKKDEGEAKKDEGEAKAEESEEVKADVEGQREDVTLSVVAAPKPHAPAPKLVD